MSPSANGLFPQDCPRFHRELPSDSQIPIALFAVKSKICVLLTHSSFFVSIADRRTGQQSNLFSSTAVRISTECEAKSLTHRSRPPDPECRRRILSPSRLRSRTGTSSHAHPRPQRSRARAVDVVVISASFEYVWIWPLPCLLGQRQSLRMCVMAGSGCTGRNSVKGTTG